MKHLFPAPQEEPLPPARSPEQTAALDRAARGPVLALLLTGLFWLAVAGLFQVLAAVKLHAPGLLAGQAWLTYGRVQPAAWNLFVYGFGIPVGMGVAAWLTSRLSDTPLAWRGAGYAGVKVWSIGVFLGVAGILAGHGTGVEGLEMPARLAPVLFAGYGLMAAMVWRTFLNRRGREIYLSQWHILAAVLAFPWFYFSAVLLAVARPLRGVLQVVVASWFLHGVLLLWFGGLALAVVFYFLPKLLERPVPSRGVALVGFWTWVAGGPWGGLTRHLDGPFPAWLTSLGVVGGLWLLIPAIAFGLNLYPLLRERGGRIRNSNPLGFAAFSGGAFLLWVTLNAANSLPAVRFWTGHTLFASGLDELLLWGVFGMAMLGAVYYLVPRLVEREWPRPAWVRLHLGLAAGGVVILALAHLLGGGVQGAAINDPGLPFEQVSRRCLPFIATGTLAWLILWGGTLLLLGQMAGLLGRKWRPVWRARWAAWTQPLDEEAQP
jgi:cytochrome c oxidase cbb3-type subunit 1